MTAVLPTIDVPQLSGGRERARELLAALSGQMTGATVVVSFRNMIAGTPSFADELVSVVLDDGGAQQLLAEHVSAEFGTYLLDAARNHGAAERLVVT